MWDGLIKETGVWIFNKIIFPETVKYISLNMPCAVINSSINFREAIWIAGKAADF